PAAAHQAVGAAHLQGPFFVVTGVGFHFDVEIGVGVGPVHLGDDAAQLDGLVGVEFGGKGVVGEGLSGKQGRAEYCSKRSQLLEHGCVSGTQLSVNSKRPLSLPLRQVPMYLRLVQEPRLLRVPVISSGPSAVWALMVSVHVDGSSVTLSISTPRRPGFTVPDSSPFQASISRRVRVLPSSLTRSPDQDPLAGCPVWAMAAGSRPRQAASSIPVDNSRASMWYSSE